MSASETFTLPDLSHIDEVITVRIFSYVRAQVQDVVSANKIVFKTESDFYRIAIMKLLEEYEK